MYVKLISPRGNKVVVEIDKVRERQKGEWIHLSDTGECCYMCGKTAPFVWVDSEYQYEEHPNRCELRSNENV